MKKNRLIIEFDYDFHLLGLTSSVKFYKLAWSINKALHIDLVKAEDLELDILHDTAAFEMYTFGKPDTRFWLYRNKSVSNDSQYLIPELPHFDYIVKVPADSQTFAVKELTDALRDIEWIEYIGALEVKVLKSKDNFLE